MFSPFFSKYKLALATSTAVVSFSLAMSGCGTAGAGGGASGGGASTGPNPDTDKWAVGQGQKNGKVCWLRVNVNSYDDDSKRPFETIFSAAYPGVDKFGAPAMSDLDGLNKIEDQLVGEIDYKKLGRLMAVTTTDGKRQFLFYTNDGDLGPKLGKSITVPSGFVVTVTVNKDADWKQWQTMKAALKQN